MNKWELELPRSQYHKEATFSTIGTGGAAQGGHYHKLKLDDLVGEKARDSEPTMATSVSWFDNINSLLTEFDIDGWDLIGTRWAYSDVYSRAMSMYGIALDESVTNCIPQRELEKYANGLLRVYARGAIEEGSPIFPEKFSLGRLATIQKNPIIWATQYANNPIASGLTEFNWPLQFYNVSPDMRTITYNDGEYIRDVPISMLDIYVLVDPSMGEDNIADPTGIIVVGIDPSFNLFVLETTKERLLPPKFVDEIFRLQNKWRPKKFAIEEGNFAGIYKYWIQEKSAKMRMHPIIEPYKTRNKNKIARVRNLSHFFSAGQIYVAEMMMELREEYMHFPLNFGDIHLLDAFAQGPDIWTENLSAEEFDQQRELVDSAMVQRSSLTGY